MILINCTGKSCYRHGNIRNTEAATGDVLKIQIEVSQNSWENTYSLGLQLYLERDSDTGIFLWTLLNFWEHLFGKRLFLKTWKVIYDCGRPLSDKKLFWKYLENIQEHICVRLQLLSYKFRETKDWLNPHKV